MALPTHIQEHLDECITRLADVAEVDRTSALVYIISIKDRKSHVYVYSLEVSFPYRNKRSKTERYATVSDMDADFEVALAGVARALQRWEDSRKRVK